jgi:hypothetical protein
MNTTLDIESEKKETQEQAVVRGHSEMDVVEEVRDPTSTQVGACWCPGIGTEVVTNASFPILLSRC